MCSTCHGQPNHGWCAMCEALRHLQETAKDPRITPVSDEDFDLMTGRPLNLPE